MPYECPIDADDFDAGDESMELPEGIFDLGTAEEATFVNPFTAEEVREFCEAIQRQIIEEFDDPELAEFLPGGDCSRGYEISLRLEVSTDEERVVASKRFFLWGGNEDYNENPRFSDFEIRPAEADNLGQLRVDAGWELSGDTPHDEQWISIHDRDEPVVVLTDMPFEMRALVDPDSILTFRPSPQSEPRVEALDFRYFSTLGSISNSTRLFVDGAKPLDEASITRFSVASDQLDEDCQESANGGCEMTLWSVVRDSRLGVDWIDGRLLVQEARQ